MTDLSWCMRHRASDPLRLRLPVTAVLLVCSLLGSVGIHGREDLQTDGAMRRPAPFAPICAASGSPVSGRPVPRVVYDNDQTTDTYTDDYLMALASAGAIELLGMITSYPDPLYAQHIESSVDERLASYKAAIASGFSKVPVPVRGVMQRHRQPTSNRIEDTVPYDTAGTRLIVQAALQGPLYLVTGGPLSAAASAYLMNPAIAANVTVVSNVGRDNDMFRYNGAVDPWASYLVLSRLKLIAFNWTNGAARVPRTRILADLPDTPLRAWMFSKNHPALIEAGEIDADGPPAQWLMRPDVISTSKRVSFGGWSNPVVTGGVGVPVYRDDPHGTATIVTAQRTALLTEEFWRALANPCAYLRRALPRPSRE